MTACVSSFSTSDTSLVFDQQDLHATAAISILLVVSPVTLGAGHGDTFDRNPLRCMVWQKKQNPHCPPYMTVCAYLYLYLLIKQGAFLQFFHPFTTKIFFVSIRGGTKLCTPFFTKGKTICGELRTWAVHPMAQ